MASRRAARAVRFLLIAARETASALLEASRSVQAEMAAFDAGVDADSVRPEDLPSGRRKTREQAPVDTGGPFRRRGPTDDASPVLM